MKIEDKINKYLKEGKMKKTPKKEAIKKIIKVIKSAKTKEQLENARKMIINYAKLYQPIGSDPLLDIGYKTNLGPLGKLFRQANSQKLKIDHIKKVQKEL